MVNKINKRKKYIGKYPVNSRITIDYTKKKPTVKFGYPNKNTFNQMYYTHACIIPTMLITFILFFVMSSVYDFNYDNYSSDMQSIFNIFLVLFFVMASLIINYFVYLFYSKTKLGQKIFPEINKHFYNAHYYIKFKKVSDNKKIELPLFYNIYLDYKATKQFSKYLEKMEIVEHPFSKLFDGIKKNKKKSKQVNLWKATFYFKEIPKNGMLEMWWT